MASEGKILIQIWISAFASLAYCYFISFNIPKGKRRFLSVLPVFYLLIVLPLKSSSIIFGTMAAFFLTWLANFKLLLFSFGGGPLSSDPSISLSHFISIACFPIKVQNKRHPSPQKDSKSNLNVSIKFLVFLVLNFVYPYIQYLHPKLMSVYYSFILYLGMEFELLVFASFSRRFLGIELEPQFDEPYLTTSLQDFWGRRWNLMVSNILRPTVYSPAKLMLSKKIGKNWGQLSAVFLTFIVSGLMHEVLFYYMGRLTPSWEVTGFFVLHGVLLVLEILVKKVLKERWRLHPVISGALTIGIMVITGDWLFFPQMQRFETDVRASREVSAMLDCLKTCAKKKRDILLLEHWCF